MEHESHISRILHEGEALACMKKFASSFPQFSLIPFLFIYIECEYFHVLLSIL